MVSIDLVGISQVIILMGVKRRNKTADIAFHDLPVQGAVPVVSGGSE